MKLARKPPAIAASIAPATNAMTLYFVVLIPNDSAAISLSRTAIIACPLVLRTKLTTMIITITLRTNTICQLTKAGMPNIPAGPRVIFILIIMIRIISETPSVAIAK